MSLGGRSAVVEALGKILDARRDREADVRPARVVGRNTDGSAQLLRLDGECVSRGGQGGYPGEIVTELPSLRDRRGTAGVAGVARRTAAASLWVERLEPRALPAGSAGLEVTVIGSGFVPGMAWTFYLPGTETVNTDVDLIAATYVDSETYTLTVNVSAGATLFVDGALGFDPTNRPYPRYRKDRAYDVTAAAGSPFLAIWEDAGGLLAARYLDGVESELLGTAAETGIGEWGAQLIWADSAHKVSDRSLLWMPSETELKVWDITADAVYTVAIDGDYRAAGPPVYVGGWVWWIERLAAGSVAGYEHRLCRCRADGTNALGAAGYDVLDTEAVAGPTVLHFVSASYSVASTAALESTYFHLEEGGEVAELQAVLASFGDETLASVVGGVGSMHGLWIPETGTDGLGTLPVVGVPTAPSRQDPGSLFDPTAVWPDDAEHKISTFTYAVGYDQAFDNAAVSGFGDDTWEVVVDDLIGSAPRRFTVTPPVDMPSPSTFVFYPLPE